MTSKLKRKLDNIGLDPSSSKLNESFCLIGTPLPPLEKAKDTGEFQPLWNQEVRDEKGRRRLHGAFTGGFSAGYFNTVGSKEGWTPSTFVSSRNARAGKQAARPEDFMDEEDLAEFKNSQKLVDTTETGSGALGGAGPQDDMGAAIQNLIPPIDESVGAQMLKKMGWRPGQGVGPRVSYERLQRQDAQQAAPSGILPPKKGNLVDEEASKHTFAPRDTKVPLYRTKDDSFGLGYSRGLGLTGASTSEPVKKGPSISAGFGLGALNDADEDDLDVYDGGDDLGTRRRMAFDTEEVEDTITIGITSAKSSKQQPSKVKGSFETFHDGRQVPSGFTVAEKPETQDIWFELPEVPKGWKPDPAKLWSENRKDQENKPPVAPPPPGRHNRGMTADQRGTILGEARLPAAPKSVFDYLSAKDRERLQSFAAKVKEGAAPPGAARVDTPLIPTPEAPVTGEAPSDLPSLHPSIAKAAMAGFQPFTADPSKQARYEIFLQYHSSPSPITPYLAQLSTQTPDEFRKELQDYAKAAMIFKPATGAMANRFRSAVLVDDKPKAVEGLHIPTSSTDYVTNSEDISVKEKEEDDPKKHAAKMGMYGKLTRETTEWRPVRLLCKRFGVVDPYLNEAPKTADAETEPAPTAAGMAFTSATKDSSTSKATEASSSNADGPLRKALENIGLGEDETQGRDTLTYERPSMDIFRAIFASDDEDDESSDEDEKDQDVTMAPAAQPQSSKPKANETPSAAMDIDVDDGAPVDPSSFRPTFISREEREGIKKKKDKDGEKKDKKKKKTKTVVSFAMEDEGEEGPALSIKPKVEKKRRRDKDAKDKEPKKPRTDEDEEMQWVEKEVPPAAPVEQEPSKPGRKTAADFM